MITDEILLTHQISAKIIDIIDNADKECILITPYIQSWNLLDRAFERACRQNKRVTIITRTGTDIDYLNSNYGFEIVYVPNLHTKLYFNEKEALFSSMNMYDYSKENNFEIGIIRPILTKTEYQEFYDKVVKNDILLNEDCFVLDGYYKSIQDFSYDGGSYRFDEDESQLKSYCIRCGELMTPYMYDDYKKFCLECFRASAKDKMWNYTVNENYCHCCGKENHNITFEEPVCEKCSSKVKRYLDNSNQ